MIKPLSTTESKILQLKYSSVLLITPLCRLCDFLLPLASWLIQNSQKTSRREVKYNFVSKTQSQSFVTFIN